MISTLCRPLLAAACLLTSGSHAAVYDFGKQGGVTDDSSTKTALANTALWNSIMADTLQPGDTLLFGEDQTFYMMGGVQATGLKDVTFIFDGTISFGDKKRPKQYKKNWPKNGKSVVQCIYFNYFEDVKFTSNKGPSGALFDGVGAIWWGTPFVGYVVNGENRPKLFVLRNSKDVLFENIYLKNSPYWTFWASHSNGLEIRHSTVDARRDSVPGKDTHNVLQLSAFNTDGFDVSGKNVWIHDVNIWNQDDCIAVKESSENMLFERVNASGLGLTIGSIGAGQVVRNITFRDSYMYKTVKGIYVKYNQYANETSSISDVTYENIVMDQPDRAIWIGPAQQSDSINPCAAHPCSLCWPRMGKCNPPNAPLVNIALRDIVVTNPKNPTSVIIGNVTTFPMVNLDLRNVTISRTKKGLFSKLARKTIEGENTEETKLGYYCPKDGVASGLALGLTNPVPGCVRDMTRFSTLEETEAQEEMAAEEKEVKEEL